MGKNKRNSKANVFKVAGAKSLTKTKSKAVNLGLKNIKKKVEDIDAEFLKMNKEAKPIPTTPLPKPKNKSVKKPQKHIPSKEDVAETAEQIIKMDI